MMTESRFTRGAWPISRQLIVSHPAHARPHFQRPTFPPQLRCCPRQSEPLGRHLERLLLILFVSSIFALHYLGHHSLHSFLHRILYRVFDTFIHFLRVEFYIHVLGYDLLDNVLNNGSNRRQFLGNCLCYLLRGFDDLSLRFSRSYFLSWSCRATPIPFESFHDRARNFLVAKDDADLPPGIQLECTQTLTSHKHFAAIANHGPRVQPHPFQLAHRDHRILAVHFPVGNFQVVDQQLFTSSLDEGCQLFACV